MQSVPITTKVVSSNPARGEMYSIQHYEIKVACYKYSWFLPMKMTATIQSSEILLNPFNPWCIFVCHLNQTVNKVSDLLVLWCSSSQWLEYHLECGRSWVQALVESNQKL